MPNVATRLLICRALIASASQAFLRGPSASHSTRDAGTGATASPIVKYCVGIAFSVSLLSLAACGGANTEQAIARAEERLVVADYPAAIIGLKSALSAANKADLPRIHWLLGKAYLDSGYMTSADRELEKARQLGWDLNDVMPALAKSMLAQRKFEALEELPSSGLESPAKARVQAAQALAQLAQGDIWDADAIIAEALELQPNGAEVRLAEARIMGTMGDIAGAMGVVEQVLDMGLDNPPAWRLRAELLILLQQLPDALAAYDAAIELVPDSFDDRSKRALINLQLQQIDAMRGDAEWLMLEWPKDPMSNYVQGMLQFQDADYPGAITSLEQAVALEPSYPLVPFYLSAAHTMEGHPKAALSVAMRLVDLHPDFAPGRKMLASLYLQAGDASKIQDLLRAVLDSEPDDSQALNLMANALLLEGDTDQALDVLAKRQQLNPDSAEANFRLGAGLLLAGQNEAATKQLAQTLTLDPHYQQADILLVLKLIEEQDFDAAIEAAQAFKARNPDSLAAYSLLGKAYLANEQTDEAVATFNEALSLAPGDPAANQALAQIALQAGDTEAARKRYKAILDHRTDYLPALLQLALIEAEQGNEAELVAQLKYALEAYPKALEPRLMLGRYYLWKSEPASIPPLLSAVTELQQQSPEVLHLLALAQLAEQRHSDAVSTLEQLVQLKPDTALAHHLLGTAAAGAGDAEKAQEEFRRALALDENYTPALVGLARLAWANGDTPLFELYLKRLTELVGETPEVLRLQAAVALRAGDQAQAIELAARAFNDAPGSDTALELAGYQFIAGKSAEALATVEAWVARQPTDLPARIALASQLNHAGREDQAIKQYQAILELQPDNTTALNNLAWLLRASQPQQALGYARRAVSLEPSAPQLLDTLAVLEHLTGDNLQALRHIKLAVKGSPDNVALLYRQAQIEAALGNKSAAIGLLEKVLASPGVAFNERDKMKSLLTSLQQ